MSDKRFTWNDGDFEVVSTPDRTDYSPDEPRAQDGKWGEGGAAPKAPTGAKGEAKVEKPADDKVKTEAEKPTAEHQGASFEDWHKANPNSNPEVFSAAQAYLKQAQLPPIRALTPQNLSQEEGRNIANGYDAAKSDPENKDTVAAYHAFNHELAAQRAVIEKAGYKFEPWSKDGQPYANSKEMLKDVRDNKHLYYFKSTEGTTPNKLMSVDENDTFRAVHDLFGHAMAGNQFGPKGETNAFLDHVQMFSPDARKALATETVGQNAWFNFSKSNEGKPVSQRSFADQKAFLLDPKLYQPLIDRAMKHDAADVEDTDLYFTCPCHRRAAAARADDFNPDQTRDANGKWAGGGASGATGATGKAAPRASAPAAPPLEDNARWFAGKTEGEREHLLLEGNIGIPRSKMPQIDDKDVPAFFAKLQSEGVTVHPHEMVPAASLKPTQNEMNMAKVESMVAHWNPTLAGPVIISNDGHILDGHHRWAAQLGANPRAIIPVREIDMPIQKLLAEANAFPPTHHEGVELVKDHMDEEARDEHGRWTSGGSGAAPAAPHAHGGAGAKELAEKANAGGGFTYDPHHGKYPTEGYAVSMHPGHEEVIRSKELSPEAVKGYLDRHGDYIQQHPGAHVGGWYDADAGKWYLDVSHITNDPHEAESLAKKHNQEAYYDLGKHETVYVKSGKERRIDERQAQDTARRRTKDLLRPRQDVPRGDRGGDEEARGAGARAPGNSPEARVDYSPDEPRAQDGKWGEGGGRAAASTSVASAKTSSVRAHEHAAKAEASADRAKASKGKAQAKHVEDAHAHARETERHAREASAAAAQAKESAGDDSPSAKEAATHAAEAGAQAKAARTQASSAQKSASSGPQAGGARGAADTATKIADKLHAAATEHPTKAGEAAAEADKHAVAARTHARAAAGAKTPEDAAKHTVKAHEHAAAAEETVAKLAREAAKHAQHEPHHAGHAGHAGHAEHEKKPDHKRVGESWRALLAMLTGG